MALQWVDADLLSRVCVSYLRYNIVLCIFWNIFLLLFLK